MFARKVSMQLKSTSNPAELTRRLEKEILPLLRKQKGFQDEITMVGSDTKHALGISFWDNKENAEAYGRTAYPEVLKLLAREVEGTPQVQDYDVANSTCHEIAAAAPAKI